MGGHHLWGDQVKQIGFYEYGLSPMQQKLFVGFFTTGAKKLAGRVGRLAMFAGPPFLLYYSLANWADKRYEYYNRKVYLNQHQHSH
ncbi:hypothetical protein HK101_001948 [Irineochytrium annulatum]|nr:hypothetical protein HK101_001948 [Irineochytrium annulatum]